MTYRELVTEIREYFSAGRITDDFRLSVRRVVRVLNDIRARLVYEDLQKKRPIRESDKLIICVPLEPVDGSFCDCFVNEGCTIQKSTCPIPKIIDNKIFDISSIDVQGKVHFDYIKLSEVKWKLKSRKKNEREAVYVFLATEGSDTYLYMINAMLEAVKVQALFEDPLAVVNYRCCEDLPPVCSPLDEEILMDARLAPLLKEMTIAYLAPSMQIPEDNRNNDEDDLPPSA